ncbi:hypothetical protein J7E71_18430 [Mesobacillus foraminis]|uniref:hypothetical protein n=1 Tax=Mesobacillus foraminis TaxID=279826 RepID=UPI001BEAE961|nr:hypothetical protein [Mesobacillus foraminis]MBT2757866.1 hypothetical protein [Mesobacillus foraminis]
MNDTISFNKFISKAPDDEIWKPIPQEEHAHYQQLIDTVRSSLDSGTKKEKGDALENLMTYVYSRFEIAYVEPNVHRGDNQIDHIIKFIDGMVPPFIYQHIGLRMIGESKNHKDSIGVREVTDLVELLRSKKASVGVLSSYKTFSRGRNKSPWVNAEGKRRKLAIANNNEKIILGFTIDELETLKSNNFYTLLRQKYFSLVDEIDDDITDYPTDDLTLSYHLKLYDSLKQLRINSIIDEDSFERGKTVLAARYGPLD